MPEISVLLDGDPVPLTEDSDIEAVRDLLDAVLRIRRLKSATPIAHKSASDRRAAAAPGPHIRRKKASSTPRLRDYYERAIHELGGQATADQVYAKLQEYGVRMRARNPEQAVKTYLRQPGLFVRVGYADDGSPLWAPIGHSGPRDE